MRAYRVQYDERAWADLRSLYEYIAGRSSHAVANAYVQRIRAKCSSLEIAPKRGTKRDDLGPSHRSVGFEKSATILFRVDDDAAQVTILGVFYRGREMAQD